MIDILRVITEDEWVDPISQEQEVELIEKAKAGDEDATLALIKQYSPLIKKTVNSAGYIDRDDATQEIMVKFLEVIQTHDTDVSQRLAGRLASSLSGAVMEAGRESQSTFQIPSGTVKRYNQIMRAAGGDRDKAVNLCGTYKMKPSTFVHIHNLINSVDVIDEVMNVAGDSAMDDTIADSLLCAYGFTALDEEQETIIKTLYGFNEVVVDDHYVWADGHGPLSSTIVAAATGISTYRVKKLHAEGLQKMRLILANEEEGDVLVSA